MHHKYIDYRLVTGPNRKPRCKICELYILHIASLSTGFHTLLYFCFFFHAATWGKFLKKCNYFINTIVQFVAFVFLSSSLLVSQQFRHHLSPFLKVIQSVWSSKGTAAAVTFLSCFFRELFSVYNFDSMSNHKSSIISLNSDFNKSNLLNHFTLPQRVCTENGQSFRHRCIFNCIKSQQFNFFCYFRACF